MRKPLLMLAFMSAIFLGVNAQSEKPQNNPDEISFNGHIVRIYQTAASGYVYDIFFKNSLVIRQNKNPFTGDGAGLKWKEDAVKLAKWQILHLNPLRSDPRNDQGKISIAVARQLNITIN